MLIFTILLIAGFAGYQFGWVAGSPLILLALIMYIVGNIRDRNMMHHDGWMTARDYSENE